jgi:hypothetical protein
MSKIRPTPIDSLRVDEGIQLRVELNAETVAHYAHLMADGETFQPIVVFEAEDGTRWLADGFHRVNGARQAGIGELTADIRPGTRRDALLHAAGANGRQGLPLTPEDKKKIVTLLLREFPDMSEREIARHVPVANSFVNKVKKELTVLGEQFPERTTGKDGRDRPANPSRRRTGHATPHKPSGPTAPADVQPSHSAKVPSNESTTPPADGDADLRDRFLRNAGADQSEGPTPAPCQQTPSNPEGTTTGDTHDPEPDDARDDVRAAARWLTGWEPGFAAEVLLEVYSETWDRNDLEMFVAVLQQQLQLTRPELNANQLAEARDLLLDAVRAHVLVRRVSIPGTPEYDPRDPCTEN